MALNEYANIDVGQERSYENHGGSIGSMNENTGMDKEDKHGSDLIEKGNDTNAMNALFYAVTADLVTADLSLPPPPPPIPSTLTALSQHQMVHNQSIQAYSHQYRQQQRQYYQQLADLQKATLNNPTSTIQSPILPTPASTTTSTRESSPIALNTTLPYYTGPNVSSFSAFYPPVQRSTDDVGNVEEGGNTH